MEFIKKRALALGLALVIVTVAINLNAFQIDAAIEPTYETTYTDNFDDSTTTFEYMEEVKLSGSGDALPDSSTNFAVEDGVLKQGMTAKSSTYWQYFTFKDNYLPSDAMAEKMSVDITFSGYNNKDQTQNRILAYYDPSTGAAVEFGFSYNADAKVYVINHFVTAGEGCTVDTTNTWGDQKTTTSTTQWSSDWITDSKNRYVFTYNYFEGENGEKIIQIIGEFYFNNDFTTWKKFRVANIQVDSFTGFKTGFKACTKSVNVVSFDDFSFTYSGTKSSEQLAEEFQKRNAELLAKDSSTISVEDLTAYEAAMDDYESLTEAAQIRVTQEYEKLQTLYGEMQKKVADAFYEKHKIILDKQVANITTSDRATLFEALEDIQKLSEFEAIALATYISDLKAKEEKFYSANYRIHCDDFEHKLYTNHYWVTEKYTADTATYADYSFEMDGDNTWLVPGISTKGHMNTIDSKLWPSGEELTEVSMDVQVSSQSAATTIFSYYNSETGEYAGFKLYYSTHTSVLKFITTRQTNMTAMTDWVECTDGVKYKSTGNTNLPGFTYGETYTVKLTYSYLTGKDGNSYLYIYCSIVDSEETEVGNRYDLYAMDNTTDFKVGILCNTNTTDYAKYDNLSIKFAGVESFPGDLNNDEIIDDADAELLRMYLVGLETTITENIANVNGLNGVDSCDLVALKVLIKNQEEVLP